MAVKEVNFGSRRYADTSSLESAKLKAAFDKRLFRRFLRESGYEGRVGGWIYDPEGNPVEHGYFRTYANVYRLRKAYRNWLAEAVTGAGFENLFSEGYRPTIREESRMHRALADEYDAVQRKRGNDKRAFRGANYAR